MKITDINNYEDLELYINKRRKIKFHDNIKIKTKRRILELIYDNDCSESTYYIKGNLQCKKHKARSLIDILMLLKYYFPKSTLQNNFKYLTRFSKNIDDNMGMYIYYCPNIRKDNIHGICYFNNSRCFHKKKEYYLFNNLKIDKNCNVIK